MINTVLLYSRCPHAQLKDYSPVGMVAHACDSGTWEDLELGPAWAPQLDCVSKQSRKKRERDEGRGEGRKGGRRNRPFGLLGAECGHVTVGLKSDG